MPEGLSLEWDEANIDHVGHHDVTPEEVLEVFLNEALDLNYGYVNNEERWTSLGHTNGLRILLVVWTLRGEAIRPITAFNAGRSLTQEYLKEKGW
jgi:uncharacterized DUF497 family protein